MHFFITPVLLRQQTEEQILEEQKAQFISEYFLDEVFDESLKENIKIAFGERHNERKDEAVQWFIFKSSNGFINIPSMLQP